MKGECPVPLSNTFFLAWCVINCLRGTLSSYINCVVRRIVSGRVRGRDIECKHKNLFTFPKEKQFEWKWVDNFKELLKKVGYGGVQINNVFQSKSTIRIFPKINKTWGFPGSRWFLETSQQKKICYAECASWCMWVRSDFNVLCFMFFQFNCICVQIYGHLN
jgi:hypothetical protein